MSDAHRKAKISRLYGKADGLAWETRVHREEYVKASELYARRLAALIEKQGKINRAWRELLEEVNELTPDAPAEELGELTTLSESIEAERGLMGIDQGEHRWSGQGWQGSEQ
jgi:hypothetical protein